MTLMRIIKEKFWIPIVILLVFLQVAATFFYYSNKPEPREEPRRSAKTEVNSPPEDPARSEPPIAADKKSGEEPKENKNSQKDPRLEFLFFGDMMLDRNVGARIKEKGLDHIFGGIATSGNELFRDKDIIGANLEGAVTEAGRHYPPHNSYDFAFAPELIKEVGAYGFNFFNIANNHLADQGEKGIRETRDKLSELGFDFVGCRDGKVSDCSLSSKKIKGQEVSFLGLSMVYSTFKHKKVADLVSRASSSDLVVANVHWGVEYEHKFNRVQRNFAHLLVDNGVDVVIGHHPHVVQGMEIYKNSPIFYSLGNFVFDQYFSRATQEGLAVALNFKEGEMNINLYPLKSRSSRVLPLETAKDKKEFFDDFLAWSDLEKEEERNIGTGRIQLKR